VRQSRLLPLLIGFLQLPEYRQVDKRKTLIWCIVNVLRGGMSKIAPTKFETLIEQLNLTMESPKSSEEVLSDTVWSVAYLLDHEEFNSERINYALGHPRLIPTIIGFLNHPSSRIQAGCLRVVGNIVTGTDEQATAILRMDLLKHLVPLIDSANDQTACQAVWTLSNVAAGTEEHISELLGIQGMAETLIRLCGDSMPKKRLEAQWTIVNSTMGANDEDYFFLLSGGVGHELEHILDEDDDISLVDRTLQTIHHSLRDRPERFGHTFAVFKAVGLVGKLHKRVLSAQAPGRRDHFNWQLASTILREFFDVDPTQEVQPAQTVKTINIQIRRRQK